MIYSFIVNGALAMRMIHAISSAKTIHGDFVYALHVHAHANRSMIILFINILRHNVFVYEYNFYLMKNGMIKINIFEQLNRNELIHIWWGVQKKRRNFGQENEKIRKTISIT